MSVKQFIIQFFLYSVQQIDYQICKIVHIPQCECMGVGHTMTGISKFCPKIMRIFSIQNN